MEDNEIKTLILIASMPLDAGALLQPLYEVNSECLYPISKEDQIRIFRNNGMIFCRKHPIEKNTIIMSQVIENRENFLEDNSSSSLYQVVKDSEITLACVVNEEIEFVYAGDKHKPTGESFWNSQHIYYKFKKNLAVGPYICKRVDNVWITEKQSNTDTLQVFEIESIKNSRIHFFLDGQLFFAPMELGNSKQVLALPVADIIKRFLKYITAISPDDKYHRKVRKEIHERLSKIDDFSVFIKQTFPGVNDFDSINDSIHILFQDFDSYQEIKEEIEQLILSHPVIREEIEGAKTQECQRYLEQQRHNLNESFAKQKKEIRSLENKITKLLKKKKQHEHDVSVLETTGKEAIDTLKAEYETYVKKGKRWKADIQKVFERLNYPSDPPERENKLKAGTEGIKIKTQEEFISLLTNEIEMSDSDVNLFLETLRKQFWRIKTNTPMEMTKFISLCRSLGLGNSIAVVNIDVSVLTPSIFFDRCCLVDSSATFTVSDFFHHCHSKKDDWCLLCVTSANRAPIEGYLSPLITSIKTSQPFIYRGTTLTAPANLRIALQLDQDEYVAIASNWLLDTFPQLIIPHFTIPDSKGYAVNFSILNGGL